MLGEQSNLDMSDITDLIEIQGNNEDPLPDILQNIGTMKKWANLAGRWIFPIACTKAQEANSQLMNGQFSTIHWEVVVYADENESFKVRKIFFESIKNVLLSIFEQFSVVFHC